MANCNPGSTHAEWSHFHGLAAAVDAKASGRNSKDYENLLDLEYPPYALTGPHDADFAIHFELDPGTLNINDIYLIPNLQAAGLYILPKSPYLQKLLENGELFFVHEEDECWCKTIFRVTEPQEDSGRFALEEVPNEMGCCQSLFVPMAGDPLDYEQHIIPAGWMQNYVDNGNPKSGSVYADQPKCVNVEDGVTFEFQGTEAGDPVIGAEREITGYFTWPTKAHYMARIMSAINYIFACNLGNNGARLDVVYKANSEPPEYIYEGCEVSVSDAIYTLDKQSQLSDEPGCLLEYPLVPWSAPTCMGENCDNNGPLIYCETIDQMKELIDSIPVFLQAYDDNDPADCQCVCLVYVENSSNPGFSGACQSSYVHTIKYNDAFDMHECTSIRTVTNKTSVSWSPTVEADDCLISDEITGDCDENSDISGGAYFNEQVFEEVNHTCASLIAKAKSAATGAFEYFGAESFLCYCAWLSPDPTGAEYYQSRWRVRCETYESFPTDLILVVDVLIITVEPPGPAAEELIEDVELAWDAGEEAYVSAWVEYEDILGTVSCGLYDNGFTTAGVYEIGPYVECDDLIKQEEE